MVGPEGDVVGAFLVVQADQAGGVAGHLGGLGDHGADELATVAHLIGTQDSDLGVVGPGQLGRILVGEHTEHAGL